MFSFKFEFVCASCERSQRPATIVKLDGGCKRCVAPRWNLIIEYVIDRSGESDEPEVESLVSDVLRAGLGVPKQNVEYEREIERLILDDIPPQHAREICDGRNVRDRVWQYLQIRQKQDQEAHRRRMAEQGGRPCLQCSMFFVPGGDAWGEQGYCSKGCFTIANPEQKFFDPSRPKIRALETKQPRELPRKNAGKLDVKCVCGHSFSVAKMYAGTKRPCPQCGSPNSV